MNLKNKVKEPLVFDDNSLDGVLYGNNISDPTLVDCFLPIKEHMRTIREAYHARDHIMLHKTQLVFDLCRYRDVDQHGLMSFKYTGEDLIVQDRDCLHVVELFAQGNNYKEFHGLSKLPGVRYFGWSIV